MLTSDAQLIDRILQDTNLHLDRLQRQHLLWADVQNHIAASHIAECVGDSALVSLHLQTVTRLLLEIQHECPLTERYRQRMRPAIRKPRRRGPVARARFGLTWMA